MLLYSSNTLKNETIYFKYPYVLCTRWLTLRRIADPTVDLQLPVQPTGPELVHQRLRHVRGTLRSLAQAIFTICARCWDISDQKYLVQKLFLLRGGRVLKAEAMSMSGDRFTYWFETYQCKPLTPDERYFADRDEADILKEEGQLKNNLTIQLDDLKEFGTNSNVHSIWNFRMPC